LIKTLSSKSTLVSKIFLILKRIIQKHGKVNNENIKNPARIDKRRAKMSLNSIEEYLKTWNIEWDYQK